MMRKKLSRRHPKKLGPVCLVQQKSQGKGTRGAAKENRKGPTRAPRGGDNGEEAEKKWGKTSPRKERSRWQVREILKGQPRANTAKTRGVVFCPLVEPRSNGDRGEPIKNVTQTAWETTLRSTEKNKIISRAKGQREQRRYPGSKKKELGVTTKGTRKRGGTPTVKKRRKKTLCAKNRRGNVSVREQKEVAGSSQRGQDASNGRRGASHVVTGGGGLVGRNRFPGGRSGRKTSLVPRVEKGQGGWRRSAWATPDRETESAEDAFEKKKGTPIVGGFNWAKTVGKDPWKQAKKWAVKSPHKTDRSHRAKEKKVRQSGVCLQVLFFKTPKSQVFKGLY